MPGGWQAVKMAMFAIAMTSLIGQWAAAEEKPSQDWLIGEWDGKLIVAEVLLNEKIYGGMLTEDMIQMVAEDLQKQLDLNQIKMTFKKDGTWAVESSGPGIDPKDSKKSGKWRVVKAEKTTLKVKMTYDDGKMKDEEQVWQFTGRKSFTVDTDTYIFPQFHKK
jgi:hypothetical protein